MGIKSTTKEKFTAEGGRMTAPRQMSIVYRTANDFRDVYHYAEALLANKPVMVNLERLDGANRNRVFDYLNGVAYIINGTVDVVTDNMLIYCPQGVSVDKKDDSSGPSFWP